MRALVTGSTGFLGSHIVELLNQRGVEVLGLRRSSSPEDAIEGLKLTTVVGDVSEPASLEKAMQGVDWVFHVAGISDHYNTPPETIYRVNVDGACNVFEAAKNAGVKRLIFTSSSSAVGMPRPDKPILDETDHFNLKPHEFPYGHSKQLGEDALAEYVAQGLDAVTVLPAPIMGPRDLKFISGKIITEALKGFPALPPTGLNIIDVRDCAAGHIAAAERGRCGERYLLSGHNLTFRELAETLRDVLGTKVPGINIPRWVFPSLAEVVGVVRRIGIRLPFYREVVLFAGMLIYYDNSKAVRELGLNVRPLGETVRDTYLWYAEHGYLEKYSIPRAPRPVER
jgi:dihydroflavonol-4-reductase